jgi:hypothetical protein
LQAWGHPPPRSTSSSRRRTESATPASATGSGGIASVAQMRVEFAYRARLTGVQRSDATPAIRQRDAAAARRLVQPWRGHSGGAHTDIGQNSATASSPVHSRRIERRRDVHFRCPADQACQTSSHRTGSLPSMQLVSLSIASPLTGHKRQVLHI